MATQQGAIAVASDVRTFGDVFVNNYYRVLVLSPQSLYRFYKDSSTVGRPDPNGQMVSVTTVEAINELITSTDYSALNVEIKSVDSQACYYKGVVVCVTGSITFTNSGTRTFTHFFFLAPQDQDQERGYFVLNDVFRYLDEESQQQKPDSNQVSEPDVNLQPVAQAKAGNGAIEQSTRAVEEIVPVVVADGVQENDNDMQQSEVPDCSESAIEHFQNGGPPTHAHAQEETLVAIEHFHNGETPVAVQEKHAQEETRVAIEHFQNEETPVEVQEKHSQNEGPPTHAQEAPLAVQDEHAQNGGPPTHAQETPFAVQDEHAQNGGLPTHAQETTQEAPKESYASILKKNAAQPTFAIKKPPLVKTRAEPNSAHRSSTASISSLPNSTPANSTANGSGNGNGNGCSIFIDNLPVNITPHQVEEEMKKFGSIKPSGVQVRSRQGGGSCFGFVEFVQTASVQTALQASPILIRGCKVVVREKKTKAHFNNNADNSITEGTGCSVFISNLPANIAPSQVEEEMKLFGAIKPFGVQVRNRQGGESCYAFVQFKETGSAQIAIKASPILINGSPVYIKEKMSNNGTWDCPGNGRSDLTNNRGAGVSFPGRGGGDGYQKKVNQIRNSGRGCII